MVGTLGMIMTSPGQTYSVSVFIEYFINDLGVSRSLVSTLYTAGTLTGSFALPLVGRQIDRRGARPVMFIVAILFGLACIYMGFVRNAVMLGLGFIAIRMMGQGSLSLVSQNVINQWWVRRRGTVMGISGLLMALLGVGGFPNLINWLIPLYGWQFTYMLLGMLLLFVMAPLALVLVRSRPEQYGLQPDGGKPAFVDDTTPVVVATTPVVAATPVVATTPVVVTEEVWTRAEAMRTPIFWVLGVGLASIAMLSTGLFFHMVSIFNDNGLTPSVAASVFVPIAATTALVNLGSGILVDRIPPRLLLAVALFLQTSSLLMAQFLQGIELAFLYGIILGTTMGLMGIVNSVSWAMYFGRQYLGSITGATATILIAGSALGPMPLGIARDILGNYNLALTIAAVLPLLLGVLCLFVDKPRKY